MKHTFLMKKLLSVFMAFLMMFTMIPFETHAEEEIDSNYITVSIEKYDAEGNGTHIIKPKRVVKERWVNDDVVDALLQARGSKTMISCESYENEEGNFRYNITSVYDETMENSYLTNGDFGTDSRWEVFINNEAWNHTRYTPQYYLKGGEVVRLIFTADGGKDIGVSEQALSVNKDELIRLTASLSGDIWFESDPRYDAYQAALTTIANLNASQNDVTNALNALKEALRVPATSVNIESDTMEIGKNISYTLSATVAPSDATDKLVWSSSNPEIVSVDEKTGTITGIEDGTSTITAAAGAVSDSIEVTVKYVPATAVEILNKDARNVEARFSMQLEASITPVVSSDIVQWSVENESVAVIDHTGKLTGLSAGTTRVYATAGSVSDSYEVTVLDTVSPYVYFQYNDGRILEMWDDTFTLTALDEGKFVVGNYTNNVNWYCKDTADDGFGGTEDRYWINSSGKYTPFEVKTIEATASGNGFSKTFYIQVISSGIKELKAYANGAEISKVQPFESTGMTSEVPVTVKGLTGTNEWITLPIQSYRADSTDTTGSTRLYNGMLQLMKEGTETITLYMVDDPEIATSFDVTCNPLAVTDLTIHVPSSFVIDKWDSMINSYIGITHGYEYPENEYYITFTPHNASNQNVIWEDLTPEIAEFHETHGAGIVPKKSGTAKFLVKSESNPEVCKEVEIDFTYKVPLESAVSKEDSYRMVVGDNKNLELILTPENATESRFEWTYSKSGIVRVSETISSDTYNRYINRKIVALSEGTVTVTGTPVDHTADCAPVEFTVTVLKDSGNGQYIDYLKMAKDDIAHGLEQLSTYGQSTYGDEWNIFTTLRAGGTISEENKTAYLSSVKKKLEGSANLLPTDYARLVLTLTVLGKNPTDFEGYNLIEMLYNNEELGNLTSNQISWTLLALDTRDYRLSDDAVWTREKLIQKVLEFQAADGGFSLSAKANSGSYDITAMVLQALAPYNNYQHPEVQNAFADAIYYLQRNLTENMGYIEGGGENGCTAAQVLVALTAAKMNPVMEIIGFTLGTKNLITNLDSFKVDNGFAYIAGAGSNAMGTQQITYALEAYRRYAEDKNALYDLTDVKVEGEENIFAAEELTITANGIESPVFSLGNISYEQAYFGTVIAPVYQSSVPEHTNFVINWNFKNDGGNNEWRYFFAIDAGGGVTPRYYPFEVQTEIMEAFKLSAAEVIEYFGTAVNVNPKNDYVFFEVYDSSDEVPKKILYGLLIELISNNESEGVIRLFGKSRYETGYAVADALKETLNVEKFDAAVIASGKNFPDALAGSYLAVQKNAPVLLTNGNDDNIAALHAYIKENVKEDGNVYILGGEAAVPAKAAVIDGYHVIRLAGESRYDTNLAILTEAGIMGNEIIVATGKSFADSLSASASKLPILLVKPNGVLNDAQKKILTGMEKIYIAGGDGAVSKAYEAELKAFGEVIRVHGSSRYDTSVEIAKTFFGDVNKAVVASGKNFPDGLCGGPLAAALNVPLVLTADGKALAAKDYLSEESVSSGYVLGGANALSEETMKGIFK